MRRGILGSMAALLVSVSSVLAQPAPADQMMPPQPPSWGPVHDGEAPPVPGGPGPGAPGCNGCTPFWVRTEYLLWYVKDQPLPVPLITTSSAGDFGVLGAPSTVVLYGDQNVYMHHFTGGRISGGFCICPDPALGFEVSAFTFEKQIRPFSASSDAMGNPVLARPFFDAVAELENVALVAYPGAFAGVVNAFTATNFYGADANFSFFGNQSRTWSATLLAGFRFFEVDEQLQINSTSVILPGGFIFFNGNAVTAPNGVSITDNFDTRNQFYGGQIGGRVQGHWGRVSVELQEKFGIGGVHQVAGINGETTLITPSQTVPGGVLSQTFPTLFPPTITVSTGRTGVPGGVLATETNSGQHTTTRFALLSESSVNFRFRFTQCISVYGGYSFLYLNKVNRPGNNVDRTVNPAGIPTSASSSPFVVFPQRPAFSFQEGDFWAHGGNVGLEFDF